MGCSDACVHCGGHALDVAEVLSEEKLHVVRRATCRGRDCGRRTTPRSPPAPHQHSKVTCDWLAWLID